MSALLAHAGPDGGLHDLVLLALAMPWALGFAVVLVSFRRLKRFLSR